MSFLLLFWLQYLELAVTSLCLISELKISSSPCSPAWGQWEESRGSGHTSGIKGTDLYNDVHGFSIFFLGFPEGPHIEGADLQGYGAVDAEEEKQQRGGRQRHPVAPKDYGWSLLEGAGLYSPQITGITGFLCCFHFSEELGSTGLSSSGTGENRDPQGGRKLNFLILAPSSVKPLIFLSWVPALTTVASPGISCHVSSRSSMNLGVIHSRRTGVIKPTLGQGQIRQGQGETLLFPVSLEFGSHLFLGTQTQALILSKLCWVRLRSSPV